MASGPRRRVPPVPPSPVLPWSWSTTTSVSATASARIEEWETQLEVTRLTGLVLDPTYTGKAIHGLRVDIAAGRFGPGDHVVFWHTGGGFAPFAAEIPLAVLDRR